MVRITVHVEGMSCGMCEAHVNEAVRNAFPVKRATSARQRKETVILAQQDIPEAALQSVIGKAGYLVVSASSEPYERRDLFSGFRR